MTKINKIYLESFKAFGVPAEFRLEDDKGNHGKNLLAYGENGSGKSSLFEALRLFFYQDRMLESLKKEGAAEEVFEANKRNFLRDYNNRTIGVDFTLKINNQERAAFPLKSVACYLLGNEDVYLADKVQIIPWLQDRFMPAFDVNGFWRDKGEDLIKNVNKAIKDDFKERFTIASADSYTTLKIDDPTRGISPEKEYRRFLNEAKLHLVALLLFFETVKLHKSTQGDKIHKVVVLDDIVTSLDATNRIFLVNYLARDFDDCQVILLTHNVSFFNLVNLRVGNKVDQNADKWVMYNICEMGDNTEVICFDDTDNAAKIKDEYTTTAKTNPVLAADVAGNKIRKRFEAVMYEYAKLIQMNQFEDANVILARLIDKHKPVFLKQKSKKEMLWSNDLLDEIVNVLGSTQSYADKVTTIRDSITAYKHNYSDMKKMVDLLKEMKMFQKVVLHQLSHGTGARPTFTQTEIEHCLTLLSRFELMVNKFRNENVYGI